MMDDDVISAAAVYVMSCTLLRKTVSVDAFTFARRNPFVAGQKTDISGNGAKCEREGMNNIYTRDSQLSRAIAAFAARVKSRL
jgi:hypothetical protein